MRTTRTAAALTLLTLSTSTISLPMITPNTAPHILAARQPRPLSRRAGISDLRSAATTASSSASPPLQRRQLGSFVDEVLNGDGFGEFSPFNGVFGDGGNGGVGQGGTGGAGAVGGAGNNGQGAGGQEGAGGTGGAGGDGGGTGQGNGGPGDPGAAAGAQPTVPASALPIGSNDFNGGLAPAQDPTLPPAPGAAPAAPPTAPSLRRRQSDEGGSGGTSSSSVSSTSSTSSANADADADTSADADGEGESGASESGRRRRRLVRGGHVRAVDMSKYKVRMSLERGLSLERYSEAERACKAAGPPRIVNLWFPDEHPKNEPVEGLRIQTERT